MPLFLVAWSVIAKVGLIDVKELEVSLLASSKDDFGRVLVFDWFELSRAEFLNDDE